jgi:hypothetical protein
VVCSIEGARRDGRVRSPAATTLKSSGVVET